VPTRIGPSPLPPDKDLRHSARTRGSFAVNLSVHDIAAPDDGHVAKVLNFGTRKFKPDKLSSLGVKLDSSSEHIGLVLPCFLAALEPPP